MTVIWLDILLKSDDIQRIKENGTLNKNMKISLAA